MTTLLDAAAKVMSAATAPHLNTNRIAEVAGYSVGTLYQYFPNKEAIILALVNRERERMLAALQEVLDQMRGDGLQQRVEKFIEFSMAHYYQRRRIRRFVILSLAHAGTFFDMYGALSETDRSVEQLIHQFIAEAQRAPRPATTFVVVRAILGTLRAAVLEASPWQGSLALAAEFRFMLHGLVLELPPLSLVPFPPDAQADASHPQPWPVTLTMEGAPRSTHQVEAGGDAEAAVNMLMASQAAEAGSPLRRPKQSRSRRTVEAILLAAARLFVSRRGPEITMQQIARRAGCSAGTLYNYFPSRDAIVLAMVNREEKRIEIAVMALLELHQGSSSPQRVAAVVHYVVRHFQRYRRLRLFIFRNCLQGGRFFEFHAAVMAIDRLSEGLMQRLVEDSGRIARPATCFLMTRAILNCLRASLLENSVMQGSPALEQELHHLMMALLQSLPLSTQAHTNVMTNQKAGPPGIADIPAVCKPEEFPGVGQNDFQS